MFNKSHNTAITRTVLPLPVRKLIEDEQIVGNVLDYGCGKCAAVNHKLLDIPCVRSVLSYDPYYAPYTFTTETFETILCTYVLCVLPIAKEFKILREIQSLLNPEFGVAYITVRKDVPQQGHGYSKNRTFQRKVRMPYLDVHKETSDFIIYSLTSRTKLLE